MKGFPYQIRMAFRRKGACLMVLLFLAAATLFLLVYPQLIRSTRLRLTEAYDSLTVKGWFLNSNSYADPVIPGDSWHELCRSDFFRDHASYSQISVLIPHGEDLYAADPDPDEAALLRAAQSFFVEQRSRALGGDAIRGYNKFSASDDLLRAAPDILWLPGYDESCLEGAEPIILLPASQGIPLGTELPILSVNVEAIFRVKVVGLYQSFMPDFDGVMPIRTVEQLCKDSTDYFAARGSAKSWNFNVNNFLFTVADNHCLPELKQYFSSRGFDGSGDYPIRATIDDRILKGTVSPIESNLALLEGLYLFFFAMVTAIGFFLSFLLARGRKQDYAIMRLLGESPRQITLKALLEQSVLALLGILLGAVAARSFSGLEHIDPLVCLTVFLCYSAGAALAVLLTVRVRVMEILRDKE